MKQKLFMTAMASLTMLGAMAQKPCKVDASLINGASAEKVYIFLSDEKGDISNEPTDSVVLKKGKFSYQSKVSEPRQVFFTTRMSDGKPMQMQTLLVPGESAKLTFDGKSYFFTGSKFYNEWNAADLVCSEANAKMAEQVTELRGRMEKMTEEEREEKMRELQDEYMGCLETRGKAINEYFDAHKSEEGCIAYYMVILGMQEMVGREAPADVRNGRLSKFFNQQMEKLRIQKEARLKAAAAAQEKTAATAEGKMFADFEAEYEGKIQKLSDYVGKGKYVLVDFWASWCGPCKAEIPNLIEVYNKYKGDKFEVLGVATWDKPRDTVKSIEQLGIPYPQIMNAQRAGSDAYGIEGIPQIILFGPDGTILKRNLRGHTIEQVVKEYLEK